VPQREPKLGQRIIERLDRLGRLTRALQFCSALNPAQWEALRFLARANRYSCTPGALADYLGATKGTVSQTLMSLEEKGLVSRVRSTTDRRVVELALTPQGRRLLSDDPLAPLELAAAELEPEVGQHLVKVLDRLFDDIQRRHDLREFGICWRCQNFIPTSATAEGGGHRCGLTGEPMSEAETGRLCINFQAPAPCADPEPKKPR
jgi:DNA-binding MarR family transcriptional regulator